MSKKDQKSMPDPKTDWFEDEAFWIDLYPFLYPDERFEKAEEEVDNILGLVDFKGSYVLDLACGPGRHSVHLAKRALGVTGVDLSPFLLEKAKKRARDAKVDIEWVQEDMRNFIRPNVFDLVLIMFTSFGFFDDKNDDIKVLKNIYKSLSKGGACLIDIMGKERLARILQATTSHRESDDSFLVERHEIFDDWTRIRNEWILLKGGKAKVFKFHHTIYSGQELKDLLGDVGFKRVKLFGDLEGNEYGVDAKRLIAVAWK
jgi:SAM-dependent methyltransferase